MSDLDDKYSKQMNDIINTTSGFQALEQMNKSYDIAFGLGSKLAQMNKSYDIAFGLGSKLAQMNKSYDIAFGLGSKLSQMNKSYDIAFGLGSKLAQINDITSKALGLGVSELFEKIDFGSVEINEDGTINYLDTTINLENDINDTIDSLNVCNNENDSLEKRIYNLFSAIKNKHPILVGIIILFFIAPFYQSFIDYSKGMINDKIKEIQVRNETQNDRNKLEKDIKKEVSKEWYSNFSQDQNVRQALNEYRFVTADCLNVRVNSSTDSKVVYNLKFGQVVSLLNKNRNWALIEYTDDESICVRGWVYTRYISEFK